MLCILSGYRKSTMRAKSKLLKYCTIKQTSDHIQACCNIYGTQTLLERRIKLAYPLYNMVLSDFFNSVVTPWVV